MGHADLPQIFKVAVDTEQETTRSTKKTNLCLNLQVGGTKPLGLYNIESAFVTTTARHFLDIFPVFLLERSKSPPATFL